MIPTSRSSGITMSTASTTAHINAPSSSTGKSNHGNAPLPIQTANSPNLSLNNWKTTQHLSTAPSQESADKDHTSYLDLLADAALLHAKNSDKTKYSEETQDSSGTNKTKSPNTEELGKASAIFKEKERVQPASNLNKPKNQESDTYVCKFILDPPNQFCDQRVSLTSELKKHMEIQVKIQDYTCKFCRKKCTNPCQLKEHELTHIRKQLFVCNFCKKSCTNRGNLSQHIRIHTGERPFVCKTCGKAFSHNSNLTQHILTHTGEKNFVCDVCNKAFSRNSALTKHIKTHTKNE